MDSFSSRTLTKFNWFVAFACWLAIAVGLTGLAGSIFHLLLLRTIVPGLVAIKVNTAVCFMLLGVSLWLQRKDGEPPSFSQGPARLLTVVVAAVGLLSLCEWAFAWDLGIDQLLFKETVEESVGSVRPGLMSPITAVELILLAAAIALLDWTTRRKAWPAQFLCLTASLLSVGTLIDLILKPHHFHTHIALPTVVTLCVFSFTPICARPMRLWTHLFSRDMHAGNRSNLARSLEETWIRHWVFRFGVAVFLVAIAAVVRRLPGTGIPQPLVYITFYPAIMLPALLGGMWPGVLATLLSALCVDYYFHKPVGHFDAKSASDLVGLALFTLEGIGISVIVGFLQRKRNLAAEELLQQTRLLQAETEASTRARKEWELTFNTVSDPVMLLDVEQRIVRANRATMQLLALSPSEVLGRHCYELIHQTNCPPQTCPVQRMFKSGAEERSDVEEPRLGKIFEVVATPLRIGNAKLHGCVHVIRDITERKQAEANMHRLNRTLQALSECTEALMRAKDETSMLQRVCDVVVQVAGYRMAWVGYAEQDENKTVRPVAWAGAEQGYLKTANISWADVPRGRGPTGTGIRTGKVMTCRDATSDPNFAPWREQALQRGYRSSVVLPLKSENQVFGALMIYAAEVDAFDSQEQRLLEELANNLSYAMATLRARTEQQTTQQQLNAERQRFSDVLDRLPAYVVLLSPDYRVPFANKFFRERFGESNGKRCYEYLFGRNQPCEICETYKVLKTGSPQRWKWTGPDGRHYDIYDFPFPDTDGSPLILEMGIDITEREQAQEEVRRASLYARSLLEASLDPLVTISREGKITDVNLATEAATGVSREQLIGSDFSNYFTDPGQARRGYEEVFAEGFVHDYPLALRHTSGRITQVLYNASLFKNEKGEVEGVFAAARDVTARKLAERALQESEKAFRTLAECVPQLVWMCTPDGLNIYFNQRWVDYTGLTLEESYGRGWNTPFHPDDKQPAWNAWNHAVETGDIYRIDCRLRAADGNYRWFLIKGVPLRDEAGTIAKWFGTCTDIDDLKRAEDEVRKLNQELEERVQRRTAQLHESEQRVRRKLESILSPEGDLGNLELGDILDIPAVQSLAEDFYRLTQIPMFVLDLKGNLLVGVGWQEICSNYHRVHAVTLENCRESDLRLTAGVMPGECKLYRCKNQMWDVVTPIMVGGQHFGNLFSGQFFFTDEPPDEEFFRNQARQYGFSEEDYIAALNKVPQLSREAVQTGMSFLMKFSQVLSQLSYSSIKLARSSTQIARANAELAASNKELEAFSYSVSHDLRAPLRHISGFSKILSEEFGPSLPEEAQHHLERIQQGTSRMGALVDDLLNLARVGRQEIRLQVTGLNSLVDEVIAILKPECEGRQVEWKISSLPFIDCDAGLMKQVLQNLLSNALKFTRPRAVALIEVGQVEQEGGPIIFVRDNGVGFSMKYADKLFGVFQRLHRPEDFEGTGVGLATVQRILHKHGGKIWVESELDKGTTFYFTLAGARSKESLAVATTAGGNA